MSGQWARRVLYSEGPTKTAHDRTVEQTALDALPSLQIYQLARLRWDDGREATIAYLGGAGRGMGPCESDCLNLETGEEFKIHSTDADVAAQKLRVTDLPPAVLEAWPRDGAGKLDTPGFSEGGKNRVGLNDLRRIAATAALARHDARTTNTPAAPAAVEPERAGGTSPMPPATGFLEDEYDAADVRIVPVTMVHPAPDNPRKDVGDIEELTASIKAQGVLQPLLAVSDHQHQYRLVIGHRRLAAAIAAGLKTVPVLVRVMTDQERLEAMLAENIHRNALTPLEEAEGFHRLEGMGVKQRDIAKRMGCSQSHISKRLALLQLPERARELLDSQGISVKEAEKLSGVKDSKLVEQIVRRGVEPHVVEKALRDQAQAEARAKTRAELEKAGVQVHSENKGPSSWYPVQGGPKPLRGGGARSGTWAELPIEVDAHILQPCHAAVIDFDGHPVYICTKPKNHPEAAPKPLEQPALFKETKAERVARQAEAQRQLEESEAESARWGYAASLTAGTPTIPLPEILDLLVVGILFNDELEPAKLAGLMGFRLTERCTCGGVVTQMAEGPDQCSRCGSKVRPDPSPEPARQMQQILTRARTHAGGMAQLALALGLALTDHPYASEGYEVLPATFYDFAAAHGYQLLPADERARATARAALPADRAPAPVDQVEATTAPDPEVDAAALKKVAIAHAKVVDCPQCGSPVSADLLEGYATASNRRPGTTCPECPPPTADARKRKVAEELADAVPSEMLL